MNGSGGIRVGPPNAKACANNGLSCPSAKSAANAPSAVNLTTPAPIAPGDAVHLQRRARRAWGQDGRPAVGGVVVGQAQRQGGRGERHHRAALVTRQS